MKGLKGKNVLVTGGSSGIGQAIAIRFGQEGANVAIHYRKGLAEAQHTQQVIRDAAGGKTILVQADVSQETDVNRMMQESLEGLGGLAVLTNNAGFQIPGDSHEITVESFDRLLATNLRGAFMAAQLAIKHFLAENKPGVIINVSSVHQLIPKPRF